jgi:hypothetical protein
MNAAMRLHNGNCWYVSARVDGGAGNDNILAESLAKLQRWCNDGTPFMQAAATTH